MSISKGKRFRVLTRDHFTCRYCGRSAPDVTLHVDHVHPRSKGGSDEMENLVTACTECNLSKGATVLPIRPSPSEPLTLHAPTFPHPDTCSHWREHPNDRMKLYAAQAERPAHQEGGHVAYYKCDSGHHWSTYWSDDCRLTERQLADVLNDCESVPA